MAWIPGPHAKGRIPSTNDELEKVTGTLTDEEAQKWLARYCLANPTFMVQLLTRVELDPVQDLMLRSFFIKDYSLVIAGRGFSKSFVISLFCIVYAIAFPEVKIGIASGTFRQSKSILAQIDSFASHPKKGTFLRSCITKQLTKSNDAWRMDIGGSSIIAIPLGKVRGYRFNVLIVDELLLVSKEILDSILKPFLMVRQEGPAHDEIMMAQKLLVENNQMKESDIEAFFPNNKIIGLSSASYKFESLYKDNYVPYVNTILDPRAENVNHCVYRMSYQAAPKNYVEESAVEDMRRTMSTSMFNRELEAIFADDSGGFFSAKKIEEASIPQGEHPTVKVVGDPLKKYILSIDPNYDNSETSDDFAMSVFELNEEDESAVLVHAYALPNSTHEKRCWYLKYLLDHFRIVYIIMDNSGGPAFIKIAKEFDLISESLDLFEHDFLNNDFNEGLLLSKTNYKPEEGKIIHSQAFGINHWLRHANENLTWMIENKKIKFAAPIFHDTDIKKCQKTDFPIETLHFSKNQSTIKDYGGGEVVSDALKETLKMEFIEHLADMQILTKRETSLIELSVNVNGNQTYDLPKTMRRDNDPNRARRDSYTTLLLGAWGVKCYYNLTRMGNIDNNFYFSPRMFG